MRRRWPKTRLEDALAQCELFSGRPPKIVEVVRARLAGLKERQERRAARRARKNARARIVGS